MNELYQSLGYSKNPFTKFSAEEERDYLTSIYLKPRYYNSTFSDLKEGSSRYLIGYRGSGKTALILELVKDLKKANVFTLVIDDYDGIPTSKNKSEFLKKIIRELIVSYVVSISSTPGLLKKLDKFEKEKLSFFIVEFFQSISRQEFESVYNKVTKYKYRNVFKQIYNYFFNRPINFFISGTIEIVSDTIANSFGLPRTRPDDFYKNYIPELELEGVNKKGNVINDYRYLKGILVDLTKIITKSGFQSVVVFFDRIDEYAPLEAKIENVVNFLSEIVTDTDLLYTENLSLVFSIWKEVKRDLNANGVRFDKFKPIDVTWTLEDMRQMLEKRLKYFHNGNKGVDTLVTDQDSIEELIELANNSPRDLIRLFSTVYDEQSILDVSASRFEGQAINKGKLTFSKAYDYYSLFPSTKSKKEDIINNINRVLRISKSVIKIKDIIGVLKVSHPTAISYIKLLKDYRIVREMGELDGAAKQYEVVDPKLKYLIQEGVKSI